MNATQDRSKNIEDGGVQEEQPSNDERWSVIWAALIIYWSIDAVTVFFLALGGLIVSIIFKVVLSTGDEENRCDNANTMFIISLVIFFIRMVDMVLGCCTIGCWFCSRSKEINDRQLIPHIINCIIVGTAQCLLSLGNIVLGIIGLVSEGTDCAGSIISIVFAVLLIMDSAFEMFIWIGAYFIRINQDKATIPPIVDRIIPNCLVRWARRTRL